jgi:hypothetical protein
MATIELSCHFLITHYTRFEEATRAADLLPRVRRLLRKALAMPQAGLTRLRREGDCVITQYPALAIVAAKSGRYLCCARKATSTGPIITGTSISGPITAANALLMPKVASATAIARPNCWMRR